MTANGESPAAEVGAAVIPTATRYEFRPRRWAITLGVDWSPGRVWCESSGEWEWEPSPSNRDDVTDYAEPVTADEVCRRNANILRGKADVKRREAATLLREAQALEDAAADLEYREGAWYEKYQPTSTLPATPLEQPYDGGGLQPSAAPDPVVDGEPSAQRGES